MNSEFNCFYKKNILITGNTGFKGSWLAIVLSMFGANVIGISLKKNYKRSMMSFFENKKILKKQYFFNICNYNKLNKIVQKHKPEYVFHLAAQAIVSTSLKDPINTFSSNLMGTVNILQSLRNLSAVTAIIVTSDKCYKNLETYRGYNETDILFGSDPYSASKSCAEIAFKSYCDSFFDIKTHRLASCRAGNVIGGGDFSNDRLFPDIFKSFFMKKKLIIRNQKSTRPWQHELEPVIGYMTLAKKLKSNIELSHSSYNFGPSSKKHYSVGDILDCVSKLIKIEVIKKNDNSLKETNLLHLNSNKALKLLKWKTKLNFKETIKYTIEWYEEYLKNKENIFKFTTTQINRYLKTKY